MIKVTKDILKQIYKPRPKETFKYSYGLVLVIGGSRFYSGSPALSGLAAFRAGVDMVHIIAPKRAADIIASFSPNLAAYPLEGERLTKEHLSILLEMTKSAEAVSEGRIAVVIGGGVGRSPETQEVIKEYLSQIEIPAVVDADAIHAIAGDAQILNSKPFLITPHSFEFLVLTGKKVAIQNIEERARIVSEEARRLKTTILLKGGIDIVASYQDDRVALSEYGHPTMSVGGTGDTLVGIAAAVLSRQKDCFLAGCASAYINGRAGQLAAKKLGESLMATDVIKEIPNVLK